MSKLIGVRSNQFRRTNSHLWTKQGDSYYVVFFLSSFYLHGEWKIVDQYDNSVCLMATEKEASHMTACVGQTQLYM